jgi:hypothetical protein
MEPTDYIVHVDFTNPDLDSVVVVTEAKSAEDAEDRAWRFFGGAALVADVEAELYYDTETNPARI